MPRSLAAPGALTDTPAPTMNGSSAVHDWV